MPELAELQRDMAAALRDPGAEARAARWLDGGAALVQRRLAIYRTNVAASIAKALAAAYPVVRQVVGDECFDGLARAFQRATPSTSGDLTDYGGGFAAFVADFPATRALPYLPDLARLEWAVHRAYGAADAPAWEMAALSAVAPAQFGALRFVWAAGTAIVDSAFPIARIWTIHQPDYSGEFSVDGSIAEHALVARNGFRVEVEALGAGAAAFIAASLHGAALGAAADAALSLDANFDLGATLARAAASHLICGLTLQGTS